MFPQVVRAGGGGVATGDIAVGIVVAGIGDPGREAGYSISDSISPWNGQSSNF